MEATASHSRNINSELDFHRLFQSLGVFGHLQSLDGLLDVTIHKAREVVHGKVDTMVGHTILRVIVSTDFGRTVAR